MKIGVDAVAIDRPKKQSIDAYLKSFQPQVSGKQHHVYLLLAQYICLPADAQRNAFGHGQR